MAQLHRFGKRKYWKSKTGKSSPQTFVINDEESAGKKYFEKVFSTKKELLIMTHPRSSGFRNKK